MKESQHKWLKLTKFLATQTCMYLADNVPVARLIL